jgi:hypothetical protein
MLHELHGSHEQVWHSGVWTCAGCAGVQGDGPHVSGGFDRVYSQLCFFRVSFVLCMGACNSPEFKEMVRT